MAASGSGLFGFILVGVIAGAIFGGMIGFGIPRSLAQSGAREPTYANKGAYNSMIAILTIPIGLLIGAVGGGGVGALYALLHTDRPILAISTIPIAMLLAGGAIWFVSHTVIRRMNV